MLRPKRQPHAAQQQHHHHGHGHGHADDHSGGAAALDDELMHMNPSLMTERQQLAFLLRKTAQDASASSSSSGASDAHESSGDEQPHPGARARTPRRIQRTSKTSPRSAHASTKDDAALGSGRSRSTKTAAKTAASLRQTAASSGDAKKLLSPRSAALKHAAAASRDASGSDHAPPTRKRLKVKTAEPRGASDSASAPVSTSSDGALVDKTSPSSSSDVLRMSAFSSARESSSATAADFWSLHCALCCDQSKLARCDTALCSDALFLCPSCDQKYPTQRALGRV